jgi:hypothetical protein
MTSEMIAGLSSVAQIVCAVQSLLGALLLFLLDLALRGRFRMRGAGGNRIAGPVAQIQQ